MGSELVYMKNDEVVCDSLTVANNFHKQHKNVIRDIENLFSTELKIELSKMFIPTTYKDASGKSNKMYLMNRDGFSLLVMGFNGKKALDWKMQYIQAFNTLEKLAVEKQNRQWIDTREHGKLTRKAETDVLKELVEYAESQGSTHANMLYLTYSKLANKAVGIAKRDSANTNQLMRLSVVEDMILQCIRQGIVSGKGYKEIYQECKKRVDIFQDITFFTIAREEERKTVNE